MVELIRRSVFQLAVLFSVSGLNAQPAKSDPDYGLSFASHEVTKDLRTSLNLNPGKPFIVQGDVEIKFDLSFHRLTNAYGYVLRIIANDSLNIDLVSSPEHSDFSDLNLIINNKPTKLHFEYTDVDLKPAQWTRISIAFSARTNEIAFSWNGNRKTEVFSMSTLRTLRFYFGSHDYGKFRTSDAPPISLKDVELLRLNQPAIKWELKNHNVNEVYDTKLEYRAVVLNPTWLIDKHIQWIHRKEFITERYPSVTFDSKSGTLYAVDRNNAYTMSMQKGSFEKKKYKAGNPVYTDANQLLYSGSTGALINYDVFTNTLSYYNIAQRTWSNKDTLYLQPNYWHNNKFYNPHDSSVYTFGGYGYFTYKNDFFKYDVSQKKWLTVKTSGTIPPRYLGACGMTAKKDRVLIFGGFGSVSGKQELFPQSFYDLYSFDLRTHAIKKLWDFGPSHNEEDMVFSNSLVINEKDSCFYVLGFPKNKYESHVMLRRYATGKPEFVTLADSIPFLFHDEHSFSDLFLSESTNELIAVTAHREKDQYKVDVYSINYPPLHASDVIQGSFPKPMQAAFYYLALILGGLGCGLILYRLIRIRKGVLAVKPEAAAEIANQHPVVTMPIKNLPAEVVEEKVFSTIYLFGGFQVFDKEGLDITGKFTMTLKELFVLVLLHSVKFEKGISTTVLQEYLWPDKDEISARNNRNVNIKKLRTLLEEISGVSIENNNSYLRLTLGPSVFCDYQWVFRLLSHHKAGESMSQDEIGIMMANVKRGSLLPNLQLAWLDGFKSDISNQIIDTLLEYSQKLDVNKDDKVLLEIADSIFNYDSINQEALVIKCSVLNKKGKYSLAKTWYDHFVKEYKNLYDENYVKTFEEVIS